MPIRPVTLLRLAFVLTLAPISALAANPPAGETSSPPSDAVEAIQAVVNQAIQQNHLKGIVVQVNSGGKTLYLKAAGDSMTGVPATPEMHFRNGAMAFTYIATMLLELVDQQPQSLSLNDKLSKFLPEVPHAGEVTLKELLNMTSGYQDYVYESEVTTGLYRNPFRQWTPDELIEIGVTPTQWFEPGKNWAYSHTNYVLLGRVLEKITGMPLAEGLATYILGPMGLKQTRSLATPQVPDPVLHVFSSERRDFLHIPTDLPFYEETTFWNPSWTTAEGAVQVTDINDMTRSMEIVGSGSLLSPRSYQEQVSATLVGFGQQTDACQPCTGNTAARNFGLGVINRGSWITQTKSFAGSGATAGYLPSARLAISVVLTYQPEAFNDVGETTEASLPTFVALANALAPHTLQ
jgi:CubicO group peptidase (beta-lactamase class C family)